MDGPRTVEPSFVYDPLYTLASVTEESPMKVLRAVGLMSGTSMDGVDAALIETDGDSVVRLGPNIEMPYASAERAMLRDAMADAIGLTDRQARPRSLAAAEALVTKTHAAAVRALLAEAGAAAQTIDVIGFHGQTVLHRPEQRLTVQIGDADALAQDLGVSVVADFRAADVAQGGQGAPLVPVFHRALAATKALARPFAILNLGGIGNLTFVAEDDELIAFDTGPGNALLDDLMMSRVGTPCDVDGKQALAGQTDPASLAQLLAHPYFGKPAPKSLDRGDLTAQAIGGLSLADAAATLTAFTAGSVAAALAHVPAMPREIIVAGGGARNPAMVAALRRALPCNVRTAEELGWASGALEAQAFAYLAVRRVADLPATYPGTTGVPQPLVGGVVSYPRR
jgi:anhydro-N-acetylmuramic acid kinase